MLRLSIYAVAAVTIAAVSFFGAYRYTHTSASTNTISTYDADVDGNGAVTIADPIAALNYIGQLTQGPRPVAEQNLDVNGNIKVHDTGTVNVSVVSATNVPRTIALAQGIVISAG